MTYKRAVRELQQMKAEEKEAQKACILVRRASLKALLEAEHIMYMEELKRCHGKTFYIKRH